VSFYRAPQVKDVLASLRLIRPIPQTTRRLPYRERARRGSGDASFAQLVRTATPMGQPLLAAARAADRIPDLRPTCARRSRVAALIDDLARSGMARADPATALEHGW